MTMAQSSENSFSSETRRNEGFSLWILSRLNFKGTGSEKFRGKGEGGEFKRKREVSQES